jgi:exosortase E/protease (VPEID-CTERM system)
MGFFMAVYLWLFRHRLRFPRAFILIPCAVLIIWFLNSVRIALLVLIGTHVSSEIALGGFHSQTGWAAFIAVALGVVGVTQRTAFFSLDMLPSPAETREAKPVARYLGPLMALLAAAMVTGMFSGGFDRLYPARVVATGAAIWFFWRKIITRDQIAGCRSGAAVAIGAAVFVLWRGLEGATGEAGTGYSIAAPLPEMSTEGATSWIIFRVLGSMVTAPIAEELAFRGYLLRRLISADFHQLSSPRFTWLSFLVSSFLFGALHGHWLAGTAAGMFYAWAMYRRGRVGDAILAHATTNALIAADVLILGNWGLWG